jgi:hypothetical protein
MFSPLTVHQAKQFVAGAIKGVGVDINAINVFGESYEAEAVREPVRKIVGTEVKPQPGRNEMEIETGVAEVSNPDTKLIETPRRQAQRKSDFDGFAEIEGLKSGLIGKFRMEFAEIADKLAQVGTQGGKRGIIADIESGELFGESVAIGIGENPLREIVGEAFGKEMVAAEGLKGVMKDGCVAALFESGEKLGQCHRGNVADASEIAHGEKVKRCLCCLHEMLASLRGQVRPLSFRSKTELHSAPGLRS